MIGASVPSSVTSKQRVRSQPHSFAPQARKQGVGARARSISPKNASRAWLPVGPGGGGRRPQREGAAAPALAAPVAGDAVTSTPQPPRTHAEASTQTACHGLVKCAEGGAAAAGT